MKVIDFIEKLQTVSPSKRIGFALCESKEQMQKDFKSFPLLLFEPVCHDTFGQDTETCEQAAQNPDTPLIVFLAPIISKVQNEKEKTNP